MPTPPGAVAYHPNFDYCSHHHHQHYYRHSSSTPDNRSSSNRISSNALHSSGYIHHHHHHYHHHQQQYHPNTAATHPTGTTASPAYNQQQQRLTTGRVGSPFFCHLCHRNHYYSQCPDFKNDIVCFYNELDEGMYLMQHSMWHMVTMRDVLFFLQKELGVLAHQVRLCAQPKYNTHHQHYYSQEEAAGEEIIETYPAMIRGTPSEMYPCSMAGIVPGVVVSVVLLDRYKFLVGAGAVPEDIIVAPAAAKNNSNATEDTGKPQKKICDAEEAMMLPHAEDDEQQTSAEHENVKKKALHQQQGGDLWERSATSSSAPSSIPLAEPSSSSSAAAADGAADDGPLLDHSASEESTNRTFSAQRPSTSSSPPPQSPDNSKNITAEQKERPTATTRKSTPVAANRGGTIDDNEEEEEAAESATSSSSGVVNETMTRLMRKMVGRHWADISSDTAATITPKMLCPPPSSSSREHDHHQQQQVADTDTQQGQKVAANSADRRPNVVVAAQKHNPNATTKSESLQEEEACKAKQNNNKKKKSAINQQLHCTATVPRTPPPKGSKCDDEVNDKEKEEGGKESVENVKNNKNDKDRTNSATATSNHGCSKKLQSKTQEGERETNRPPGSGSGGSGDKKALKRYNERKSESSPNAPPSSGCFLLHVNFIPCDLKDEALREILVDACADCCGTRPKRDGLKNGAAPSPIPRKKDNEDYLHGTVEEISYVRTVRRINPQPSSSSSNVASAASLSASHSRRFGYAFVELSCREALDRCVDKLQGMPIGNRFFLRAQEALAMKSLDTATSSHADDECKQKDVIISDNDNQRAVSRTGITSPAITAILAPSSSPPPPSRRREKESSKVCLTPTVTVTAAAVSMQSEKQPHVVDNEKKPFLRALIAGRGPQQQQRNPPLSSTNHDSSSVSSSASLACMMMTPTAIPPSQQQHPLECQEDKSGTNAAGVSSLREEKTAVQQQQDDGAAACSNIPSTPPGSTLSHRHPLKTPTTEPPPMGQMIRRRRHDGMQQQQDASKLRRQMSAATAYSASEGRLSLLFGDVLKAAERGAKDLSVLSLQHVQMESGRAASGNVSVDSSCSVGVCTLKEEDMWKAQSMTVVAFLLNSVKSMKQLLQSSPSSSCSSRPQDVMAVMVRELRHQLLEEDDDDDDINAKRREVAAMIARAIGQRIRNVMTLQHTRLLHIAALLHNYKTKSSAPSGSPSDHQQQKQIIASTVNATSTVSSDEIGAARNDSIRQQAWTAVHELLHEVECLCNGLVSTQDSDSAPRAHHHRHDDDNNADDRNDGHWACVGYLLSCESQVSSCLTRIVHQVFFAGLLCEHADIAMSSLCYAQGIKLAEKIFSRLSPNDAHRQEHPVSAGLTTLLRRRGRDGRLLGAVLPGASSCTGLWLAGTTQIVLSPFL